MGRRRRRLPLRARIAWHGLVRRPPVYRAAPAHIEAVLIAHNLLLGDTLMLTPLLARLRRLHPAARLVMTCPPALLPLYESRPFGLIAVPFDPRDPQSLARARAYGPFDLGIVPGESRHGWFARATGARWVRGYRGGAFYYRASLDEALLMPAALQPLPDMMAALAGPPAGDDGERFDPADWPAPASGRFVPPDGPFAVLHLGAGSPLKYWPAPNWRALAAALAARGLQVLLSAGPGQEDLARAVNAAGRYQDLSGRLSLADMWHMLAQARVLVSLDTGIAHLARITQTPAVVLFGPGQAALYGAVAFFRDTPFRTVTVATIPCRNERLLFERERPWIQTCVRAPRDCAFDARCSKTIPVAAVIAATDEVLENSRRG